MMWACVANSQVITTIVGTDWSFPPTLLPAINAPLGQSVGVAVDAAGNAYVADSQNDVVFRVTPAGSLTVLPAMDWSAIPETADPLRALLSNISGALQWTRPACRAAALR